MPWGPDNEAIEHMLKTVPGAERTEDGAGVTFSLRRLPEPPLRVCHRRVKELEEEKGRLREALSEVEWVWTGVENIWRCPLCEALREVGHQPGCKVGSALKEGE